MISFIIPTLNESEHIKNTICSIKSAVLSCISHNIIVVDNGSSDRTAEIAEENGASVYQRPNYTIASNRNYGANKSSSEILVFLDADVYLEADWGEEIQIAIEQLKEHPLTVTGSVVGIKNEENLIEQCWFKPRLEERKLRYINSGHMIMTRELFQKVGGFRDALETGEDYDFCLRARKIGTRIINNPRLRVVHQGYPKNICQFFRRERWHGRGDFSSLQNIVSSKPALIVVGLLIILVGSIVMTFLTSNILFPLMYIIIFSSLCFLAAIIRCRLKRLDLGICFFLYHIYFVARTFALFDVILNHGYRKHEAEKVK